MRILIVGFIAIIFFSCKKDPVTPDPKPDPTPPSNTTIEQLLADSIFLFSKEMYYWQDKIGSVTYDAFNPRQYVTTGDPLKTAESVMATIRTYNTYDQQKKYSYAEAYSGSDISSAATETGYGFDVKDAWNNRSVTPSYRPADFSGWYVNYVYPNSDAGQKGVLRGMKLAKVNGTTLGYTQASIDILNNMFAYETLKSVEAQFVKANGDTLKITISDNSHTIKSVLYSTVLSTPGGRKAGYLVYKNFDKLSDSQPELDGVFQSFKNQSVSSIIIDMRCNNGGYTQTQDYLTNHIAPNSANGSLMYKYYYNSNLQAGNFNVLKTRYPSVSQFSLTGNQYLTVNFNTSTSLNIPKVYVIVSSMTASSSELFINSLKPVLGSNLVIIGDKNTRGKPVGFFPIDLFKKVTFWTVSFMTRNSVNDSVSYNGFIPDYKVYDGVDKNWGDITEDCTAAAITLIDGGMVAAKSESQTTARSVQSLRPIERLRKQNLKDNMLFPGRGN